MTRSFEELITIKEELHKDLKEYLIRLERPLGWPTLKHPLVFGIPYTEQMNAFYNEQYKFKKKHIEELRKEKKWNHIIFMYERPYRLQIFMEIKQELNNKEYWELLGTIWTDSENLWQWKELIPILLEADIPGKLNIMDENEQEFYKNLPDEFRIFRGYEKRNRNGYSWTLSFWRAKWFAQRFKPGNESVVTAICSKQDIDAVFLGRNEFEIVVNPKKLKELKSIKKLERPALFHYFFELAYKEFELGKSSAHGPWHWEKVERNVVALCQRVKEADLVVCRLFAILHDCKRKNENDDPEHGHRAADFAESLKLPCDKSQLKKLVHACKFHADGLTSDDPTIAVCWDADRLDLSRVGMIPNPKLLSTTVAKEMIWRI